jgi:hypothetical protein
MGRQAADLAHRLAHDAEAVCRHYLSNGYATGAAILAKLLERYPLERIADRAAA